MIVMVEMMMIETSHDDREARSDDDNCWRWKQDLAALFKTMMMVPVVVIVVVMVREAIHKEKCSFF